MEASKTLAQRFKPTFVLSSGEPWLPCDYNTYLANANLVERESGKVIREMPQTVGSLSAMDGVDPAWGDIGLALPDDFRSNQTLRGSLDAPLYFNTITDENGDIVINYIVFFSADTGKRVLGLRRIGNHMADVEHVSVVVDKESLAIRRVYFSSHTTREGRWVDGSQFADGKITVYVTEGSHGMYWKPGGYVRFYGFGNDIADGLGPVWDPKQLVEVTPEMTKFRGTLGRNHVTNWGGGWFTDNSYNRGGQAPPRVPVFVGRVMPYAVVLLLLLALREAARRIKQRS